MTDEMLSFVQALSCDYWTKHDGYIWILWKHGGLEQYKCGEAFEESLRHIPGKQVSWSQMTVMRAMQ